MAHHDRDELAIETWTSPEPFAREFRRALEDLGPTFVKLGQLLSARSDVISPRLQRELAMLRDHAPSISRTALVAEFERSLGPSAIDHFATFDFVPVACASIGQVHRATLADGRRVAVKVRRPGVRAADRHRRRVAAFAPECLDACVSRRTNLRPSGTVG